MTRGDPRLVHDHPRPTDVVHRAPPHVVADLPGAVDLRTRVAATDWPVWDQLGLPSCTAHAVAGAALFEMAVAKRTPLFQPSRLFLYYCERVLDKDVSAAVDSYVRDGMQVLMDHGVCADASAPDVPADAVWKYDPAAFATKPPAACFAFARRHVGFNPMRVAEKLEHLRGRLAQGHPFTICISMFASFESPATKATGDVPMPTAAERAGRSTGHAMAVVGYDDAKKLFLVRNSMGTTWGQGGYGTMPYDYVLDPVLSDQYSFWTLKLEETPPRARKPKRARR